MDDLISRQAAIDVLHEYFDTMLDTDTVCPADIYGLFETMPSAQPDSSVKIQEILDYLDANIHPLVSPEHWNVYSELHDMISGLPSAHPERKKGEWIPSVEMQGRVECNNCHKIYDWDSQAQYYDFCPFCGKDMRK